MKFIKLTNDSSEKEIFVSPEKIKLFWVARVDSFKFCTQIGFDKDHYIFVKETPEEILAKIEELK